MSYNVGGTYGLLTNPYDPVVTNVDDQGYPSDGSRQTQWGWQPVGGATNFDTFLTPNDLIPLISIGSVTITTT